MLGDALPRAEERGELQQRDRPAADAAQADQAPPARRARDGDVRAGRDPHALRDRAAGDRRRDQRRAGRTWSGSAAWRRSPRRRPSCRRACRRTASRSSTPTTRWCGRWPTERARGRSSTALSEGADVRATDDREPRARGRRRSACTGGARASLSKTQLPGRHIVSNALAAAAVGLADGMSLEDVAAALAQARRAAAHAGRIAGATARRSSTTRTTPARPR